MWGSQQRAAEEAARNNRKEALAAFKAKYPIGRELNYIGGLKVIVTQNYSVTHSPRMPPRYWHELVGAYVDSHGILHQTDLVVSIVEQLND